MFPERCDRRTVSYLEGERVPKNWGVVTKRIRKVFNYFELYPIPDWKPMEFFS